VTGAGCSRLLGVAELRGTRRTTQTHSRDRNLQRRGLLAQSRRRICFIPDDEGIVVPVCVADTLGGLEPGGAAQLPKAVVHFHNSGINALLHSSVAQLHRATTASCGTHPQRQRTHNNLRQSAVPSTRATACLAKPSTWLAAARCGNHLLRQLADQTNLRQHAVLPTRASLSSAKPRK
jgi:hypothetical protein